MRIKINLHKKKFGENLFVPGLKLCFQKFSNFFVLFCNSPLWYHISLTFVHQFDSRPLPYCPYSCSIHKLHPIVIYQDSSSFQFLSFPFLWPACGYFTRFSVFSSNATSWSVEKVLQCNAFSGKSWYIVIDPWRSCCGLRFRKTR